MKPTERTPNQKINLTQCVFAVMKLVKDGIPLGIAINDVANSVAYDFASYQRTWDFLDSFIW